MAAVYRVRLSTQQRDTLRIMTRCGTGKARELSRARTLLLADRGLRDDEIADAVGLNARPVQRLRRRCVEEGVEAALHDRPRPGGTPLLDGAAEARLVAEACSAPPTGQAGWTMRTLAARLVELEVVGAISDETVRRTLKKTISSPGGSSSGASPR